MWVLKPLAAGCWPMESYKGLFAELRLSNTYVKRRRRRGLVDQTTQDDMFAKLAALYRSLDNQPLYQALVLVNEARMDHVAGRREAEAAAYVEAGKRFMEHVWPALCARFAPPFV